MLCVHTHHAPVGSQDLGTDGVFWKPPRSLPSQTGKRGNDNKCQDQFFKIIFHPWKKRYNTENLFSLDTLYTNWKCPALSYPCGWTTNAQKAVHNAWHAPGSLTTLNPWWHQIRH